MTQQAGQTRAKNVPIVALTCCDRSADVKMWQEKTNVAHELLSLLGEDASLGRLKYYTFQLC